MRYKYISHSIILIVVLVYCPNIACSGPYGKNLRNCLTRFWFSLSGFELFDCTVQFWQFSSKPIFTGKFRQFFKPVKTDSHRKILYRYFRSKWSLTGLFRYISFNRGHTGKIYIFRQILRGNFDIFRQSGIPQEIFHICRQISPTSIFRYFTSNWSRKGNFRYVSLNWSPTGKFRCISSNWSPHIFNIFRQNKFP